MAFSKNGIKALIDAKINAAGKFGQADQTTRRYLGASVVCKPCTRLSWYAFHWAFKQNFDARMLRLFDRGHSEEARFVTLLELIGCEVQRFDPATVPSLWWHPESEAYIIHMGEIDPSNQAHVELASQCLEVTDSPTHIAIAEIRGQVMPKPKQFGFKTMDGHHAGNCDGRARFVPGVEEFGIPFDEWIMLEFKTHNTKSFCKLIEEDEIEKGKKEHAEQMQRYMNEMGFRLTLYNAVNKNDDDLAFDFLPVIPDPQAVAKAREAIYSFKAPQRLSNSASWFECKFCDARPQCHFGAPLPKNCRTCQMSTPIADGRWHCSMWKLPIPQDAEAAGCDAWRTRTD